MATVTALPAAAPLRRHSQSSTSLARHAAPASRPLRPPRCAIGGAGRAVLAPAGPREQSPAAAAACVPASVRSVPRALSSARSRRQAAPQSQTPTLLEKCPCSRRLSAGCTPSARCPRALAWRATTSCGLRVRVVGRQVCARHVASGLGSGRARGGSISRSQRRLRDGATARIGAARGADAAMLRKAPVGHKNGPAGAACMRAAPQVRCHRPAVCCAAGWSHCVLGGGGCESSGRCSPMIRLGAASRLLALARRRRVLTTAATAHPVSHHRSRQHHGGVHDVAHHRQGQ
jgi:hypothetical protein